MIHSILSAALVFAVLVVVHEAGHFAMAKKVGVRVLRFSVGYPPKIFGIRRGETDYALGATPFGGYVRMLGDEVRARFARTRARQAERAEHNRGWPALPGGIDEIPHRHHGIIIRNPKHQRRTHQQ